MFKKANNTVPNIWAAQENTIHLYRCLAIAAGVVALALLSLTIAFAFRDPIVVVKEQGRQEFYPSMRNSVEVGKVDVQEFTKRFLEKVYVWQAFDAAGLAKDIGPYVDEALIRKIVDTQSEKYGKELKGKRLSQAISFVRVDVLPDRVVCAFDRILKIEGVPLVIPTELTLSMIQGSPSRLNPMGVYVSGILEHEGAR